VSLDLLLWLGGVLGAAVMVGLLAYRHAWKSLPWFFSFCIWALIGDLGAQAVMHYAPHAYLNTYVAQKIIDSTLEFCVLVELAWSVFRPYRASLPKATPYVLGAVIAAVGLAIWPFADSKAFAGFSLGWRLLGRVDQTDSILKVLFFLILAGCSQLLSIGWRDRELQVATGLGFYSLVSLAVSLAHTHQTAGVQYRHLDQVLIASYIGSLVYWVFSFSHKEAERREFSPQMQGLLLAVAGAARSTRISMTDASGSSRNGGRS
jgi:hypothetical protein